MDVLGNADLRNEITEFDGGTHVTFGRRDTVDTVAAALAADRMFPRLSTVYVSRMDATASVKPLATLLQGMPRLKKVKLTMSCADTKFFGPPDTFPYDAFWDAMWPVLTSYPDRPPLELSLGPRDCFRGCVPASKVGFLIQQLAQCIGGNHRAHGCRRVRALEFGLQTAPHPSQDLVRTIAAAPGPLDRLSLRFCEGLPEMFGDTVVPFARRVSLHFPSRELPRVNWGWLDRPAAVAHLECLHLIGGRELFSRFPTHPLPVDRSGRLRRLVVTVAIFHASVAVASAEFVNTDLRHLFHRFGRRDVGLDVKFRMESYDIVFWMLDTIQSQAACTIHVSIVCRALDTPEHAAGFVDALVSGLGRHRPPLTPPDDTRPFASVRLRCDHRIAPEFSRMIKARKELERWPIQVTD
jgi:hypothetical protein